jgi:hypothetical protein
MRELSDEQIRPGDHSASASFGSFSVCTGSGQTMVHTVAYRSLVAELQLRYRFTSPRQVFELYPELGPPWEAEIRAAQRKH